MRKLEEILWAVIAVLAFVVWVAGCVGSLNGRGGDGAAIAGAIVFVGMLFYGTYEGRAPRSRYDMESRKEQR